MKKIAVLLLTAALLSLCACQPTPEESVVWSANRRALRMWQRRRRRIC